MDLSHIKGVTNEGSIANEGTAKGESGLGHWRRALNGNCLSSTADAHDIVRAVLSEMNVHDSVKAIRFAPKRASVRGTYGSRVITLYGPTRLATLLHELAHHVVVVRHGHAIQSHGKVFKRTFIETFRAFGSAYEVDIQGASMEALLEMEAHADSFKPGDVVESRDGRKFEVTGYGRTRLKMTCLSTKRKGYSVKAEHVKLVGRPVETPKKKPVTPQVPRTPIQVMAGPSVFSDGSFPIDIAGMVNRSNFNREKTIKAMVPTPSAFNVGDEVINTRQGIRWIVAGFTDTGRVELDAVEAWPADPIKFPAGRRTILSQRSIKKA